MGHLHQAAWHQAWHCWVPKALGQGFEEWAENGGNCESVAGLLTEAFPAGDAGSEDLIAAERERVDAEHVVAQSVVLAGRDGLLADGPSFAAVLTWEGEAQPSVPACSGGVKGSAGVACPENVVGSSEVACSEGERGSSESASSENGGCSSEPKAVAGREPACTEQSAAGLKCLECRRVYSVGSWLSRGGNGLEDAPGFF